MADKAQLVQVREKAKGAVESLTALTPEERSHRPSGAFARNYNSLRLAAMMVLPGAIHLLPPEAEVERTPTSLGEISRQTHAEILSWSNEIYRLLTSELAKINGTEMRKRLDEGRRNSHRSW